MIANAEDLRSALSRVNKRRTFDSKLVDDIVETAVFYEGRLKSFKADGLRSALTVDEFEEFLKFAGFKVELGDPSAAKSEYHRRYDAIKRDCDIYPTFYC